MNYTEKKIRLSCLSQYFQLFVYSLYTSNIPTIHGEKYGTIYYVEDGYRYIEDGKFNREKYMKSGEGLFL